MKMYWPDITGDENKGWNFDFLAEHKGKMVEIKERGGDVSWVKFIDCDCCRGKTLPVTTRFLREIEIDAEEIV